jgi:hypothetical protein
MKDKAISTAMVIISLVVGALVLNYSDDYRFSDTLRMIPKCSDRPARCHRSGLLCNGSAHNRFFG